MTENNAAQAVQESERNAAADEYFKPRAWLMDTNANRRIFEAGFDRAYALLSKLRAEGVQAGDERAGLNEWPDLEVVNRIVRSVCETEPADPDRPDSVCISVAELQAIIEVHVTARDTVADESPMAKMADALREKAHQERQAYQDSRVQTTEWGPMPEGTEADTLGSSLPVLCPNCGVMCDGLQTMGELRDTGVLSASAPVAGESVCKGSMALGSGCGACERCKAELQTGSAPVAGEVMAVLRREIGESSWFDHRPVRPGSEEHAAIQTSAEWDYCPVYAAPQASEAVRNQALEEAAEIAENSYADAHIRIRALKTQADKDGGDCAKGAGEALAPVFQFLLGEGPLRGVEFGDRHPDERGAYWWRKDLRAALAAQKQGDSDA